MLRGFIKTRNSESLMCRSVSKLLGRARLFFKGAVYGEENQEPQYLQSLQWIDYLQRRLVFLPHVRQGERPRVRELPELVHEA